MINKVPNVNSANRVETPDSTPTVEPILEGAKENVISKSERNKIIFNTSQKLMEAGVEIMPVSSEMAAIFLELGDNLLNEIDLSEEKMSEDEVQSVINDILSIKDSLNEQ
jgi:tyrosyl-tRNA synthetase